MNYNTINNTIKNKLNVHELYNILVEEKIKFNKFRKSLFSS